MIAIVCVDNAWGMMFNHRRQSRDSELRRRILQLAGTSPIRMNAYSAEQFEKTDHIACSEDFARTAEAGDFCFFEDSDPSWHFEKIDKIIIYRWNRIYPADAFFRPDFESGGWFCEKKEDFPGNSHGKITEEIWVK